MRKRMISLLLVLALCLTLSPTATFAEELQNASLSTPQGETAADGPADAPEQGGQEESQPAPEDAAEPEAEADDAVTAVQALIDALPDADELDDMNADELDAAYADTQAAYEAYDALTAAQQALLTGADCFEALFGWFNAQVAPLENISGSYDAFDDKSGTVTGTGGTRNGPELTEAIAANPLRANFYVVKETTTINGDLTLDGTTSGGLVLAEGVTLTVEGALIHKGGSGFFIYGQSDKGKNAGRLVIKNSSADGAAIRTTGNNAQLGISSGELEIYGNGQKLIENVTVYSASKVHKGLLDGNTAALEDWSNNPSVSGGKLVITYCKHDGAWYKPSGDTQHTKHCADCGFAGKAKDCGTDGVDGYVPDGANGHYQQCPCGNKFGDVIAHDAKGYLLSPNNQMHIAGCGICGYQSGWGEQHVWVDGVCTVCKFAPVATGDYDYIFESVQDALDALAKGDTISAELYSGNSNETVIRDAIAFNYPGKTLTLNMNGYTLEKDGGPVITVEAGTLIVKGDAAINQTAKSHDGVAPAIKVTGGELIFEDALHVTGSADSSAAAPAILVEDGTVTFQKDVTATAVENAGTDTAIAPAVKVSGGKAVFNGALTATGGLGGVSQNKRPCEPAVYANGGELEFNGDLDLNGGLTVTGSAKLTHGLTQGTFKVDYSGETVDGKQVSVVGSTNYKSNINNLLAADHAFVTTTGNQYLSASYESWSGSDVTIVEHTHEWVEPASGDIYVCKDCGASCAHEGGFATGKCEVCGKPCSHGNVDSLPDGAFCRDCGQKMLVLNTIGTRGDPGFSWAYFTNLKDAMAAAGDGWTVKLLDDIALPGRAEVPSGKTVTLDLNGYKITNGWIDAGEEKAPCTLKIIGTGGFEAKDYGTVCVWQKNTLDLSGWKGGTISTISVYTDSTDPADEAGLIIGPEAGTIKFLSFSNNKLSQITKTKLSGGTYDEIQIFGIGRDAKPVKLGELLAEDYAFQNEDGTYVEYSKTLENASVYNVKAVKCPHEKIENGTCAYCGRTGIAATLGTEIYTENNIAQAFNYDWQIIDGATLTLHQDCSVGNIGWYGVYNGTLDLNGHTLTMAENTSMEVSGGSSVTVVDNSANGGGKIDGRVWVSWGSLTLESGEITSLDVSNMDIDDVTVKLRGGTVTSSASGGSGTVLVYRLLEDGCYLEGSALLAAFSGGPYEVKSAHIAVSGEKSGEIAIGKNIVNIPVSLTLADTSTTAVQFDWYRVGTDKNDLSKLASQTAAVTDGTAAYDPATAEKSLEAGWDSLAQDTDYTLVCMATGMAGAEVSWQAALTGYTLTMLPPSLEDAEITFANGWQKKTFWPDPDNNSVGKTEISSALGAYTVTFNGIPLTEGTDYTVRGNVAAAIGTHDLTITGIAPNYSGTKTVQWTVVPHELAMLEIKQVSKQYDGTDALPDGAFSEYFNSNDGYGQITLKEGMDYVVTGARFDTPDASSENKGYRYTVELKNPNYVFADGTRVHTAVYGEDAHTSVSITKAGAPAAQEEGTLEIVNNHAASYTFNLAALLPAAPVGEYGTVTYGAPTLTLSGIPHTTQTSVNSKTGELTLTVDALDNNSTGKIGTITVTVTTQNYENITLTVNLNATNKIIPTGRPILSKTTLAWDEPLTAITLSGAMRDEVNGRDVTGTFAWDGTNMVSGIGRFPMTWTFTPDDEAAYSKAGGFSEIEIVKATPTGAPKYTAITASGKTLADAALAVNENWPEGTVQWVDESGTELDVSAEVKANTAYRWRFVPTDTEHYNEASGTITLYVVSHSGGGGGSSAPTYPVNTPSKAEGGTVAVSPKNAQKGDTVTITVQPGSGYVLGGLTVTDKDGKELKLTPKGNGRYTFTMPEGGVDIQPSFTALAEGVFGDVPAGSYYADAVKWAAEQGITGGIGNGLFGPYRPCTRGQIVTFLWRAAGSPEPKNAVSLTDVPADAYYAKAVAWAMENGITLGTTDTTFSPDTACTRAQSVTFLFRAANASASGAASFTDVPAGSYYADAVKWAVDNGVTNGTTDTTFSPDTGCTRAQIVTFLWRQQKAG